MNSGPYLASLLLIAACANSADLGTHPRLLPPYIPIGGVPLARLGDQADTAVFRFPSGILFGGRAASYRGSVPAPYQDHEYSIIALDSSSSVQCIVYYRNQLPESWVDSLTTMLGSGPRFTHEAHNLLNAFWWDDRAVLVVSGWVKMSSVGANASLIALKPGETFDPEHWPMC